jgi:DNA-binding transcriptional MocR family regulator
MHLTPVRNAVLGYAEWCCDRRRPWPKLRTVAADLARNLREVERAFAYLEAQGVVSVRYEGPGYRKVLRLWDGRETATHFHVIHRHKRSRFSGRLNTNDERIAS